MDNDFLSLVAELFSPAARRKRAQDACEARLRSLFRDRDHARQVWDDWDGMSSEEPGGENAHADLNLIGDGSYCAV